MSLEIHSFRRYADVSKCGQMGIKVLKDLFATFQRSSMPKPESVDLKILYETMLFIGMFLMEITMSSKVSQRHKNRAENAQV